MASRTSFHRQTPSIENVKDVPMPPMTKNSIPKVSLPTQGSWTDSSVMRAAAIFYICVSAILFLAIPAIASKKINYYSILVMGAALVVNFCVASHVLSHLINSKA